MRVLHVLGSLDPRMGGPPRVALELAVAQASSGLKVTMLCQEIPERRQAVDRFLTEMHADTLEVHRVVQSGGLNKLFAQPIRKRLRQLIPQHDVVHIHGVWNPALWWTARESRRLAVPYIIRPTGVFKPHAMRIKTWKKRLALSLLYRPTINCASLIHVAAVDEAQHLRCYGLKHLVHAWAETACNWSSINIPLRPQPGKIEIMYRYVCGRERQVPAFVSDESIPMSPT